MTLAATTLERRRAIDALRQRVNDLVILNDSSRTLLNYSDLAGISHTVCHLAVSRLGADAAWIEGPGGEGVDTRVVVTCGISPEAAAGLKARWNETNPVDQRKPLVRAFKADEAFPYHACAIFPLMLGGELLGLLTSECPVGGGSASD